MKKKVASMLATMFVLGTASTTFAAPTDEEVAALRSRVAELERLVREQNNSTARQRDVDYLNSRVTELENSSSDSWADKFKITGEMRYRFWGLYKNPDASNLQLRLFPTFQIDEHFAVKSRLTGSYNIKNDGSSNAAMTYAYLEAKYDNFQVNAGKMPLYTNADGGLIADDFFSGIQFITGDDTKLYVNGGHWSGVGADYLGAEVTSKFSEELNAGVGYHYFKRGNNDASILAVGANYQLNEDWGLQGALAHNTDAGSEKTGFNIEADYQGAKKTEKGTWGAYAAYRYIPTTVGIAPTYDTFRITNKKGFEVGATWTPYQNTLTKLAYFHGKRIFGSGDDRTLFARASIFF